MKNLIFVLALSSVTLSCSEDDTPTKSTELKPGEEMKAPFVNFWFTTNFSLPARETTEWNDLTYLNTWAYLNEEYPTDEFNYYLTQAGTLSPETSLSVDLKQTSLSITAEGVVPRNGSVIPAGFEGDASEWPEEFSYKIVIAADPVNMTVTAATLEFISGSFNIEYDIKPYLTFAQFDKYGMPEWSIYNNEHTFLDFENIRIAFAIDDIIGTQIKK